MKILFLIILIFFTNDVYSETTQPLPRPSNKYFVITMTKSGTQLLNKLMRKLSSNRSESLIGAREYYQDPRTFKPNYLDPNANISFIAHLNHSPMIRDYLSKYPGYVKILLVRDLRDVCVSTIYYLYREQYAGYYTFVSDKINLLVCSQGFFKNSVFNVEKQAHEALQWMQDPSVVICRFEDLCGENGGGSRAAQERQIITIANALNISLTQQELNDVIASLWGGTDTFRKGQIGSWKSHFSKKLKKQFKNQLGPLLIGLGYERDNSW